MGEGERTQGKKGKREGVGKQTEKRKQDLQIKNIPKISFMGNCLPELCVPASRETRKV